MSFTSMKFPKPKPRYRLNLARFLSIILVFLLALTAVLVIIAKDKEDDGDNKNASIVVTPVVSYTPPPTPTPTPYPVPEGKEMVPVLIVVDPGHGGPDPGTESPYEDGFYEKEVALDIAKKIESLLTEKGVQVVLTRETDELYSTDNREDLLYRANIANNNNASLFVSIHVNAYDLKYKGAAQVNGMEIYYLNKEPIYENFTDERLAQIMGETISSVNGIKFNGIRSNDFSVLRNTRMPAVLIETAYITNKEDHDRLKSDEFRNKTAQGIVEGIELFLEEVGAFEHEGEMYVFKEIGE